MSEKEIFHNVEENTFYFECPNCNIMCQVPRSEIRCTIFRHANFKKDMSFVHPHASIEECDRWIKDDIVWGRISMLIRKFTSFLVCDDKKMKSILKDKINENISRKEQEPSQTAYIGSQEVQEGHEGRR